MTRLKLTLCSVMKVSALEGIQDKEIAKIIPTEHPGERNGRFVGFFKNKFAAVKSSSTAAFSLLQPRP